MKHLILLVAIIPAFFFGAYFGEQTAAPVIIKEYIEIVKDRPVRSREYVPVYIDKIIEVEVVVEIRLRDFETREELQAYLDSKTPTVYFWNDGGMFQCMDYCAVFIRDAGLDGYRVYQEGTYDVRKKTAHAVCEVKIDGEWIRFDARTLEYVGG